MKKHELSQIYGNYCGNHQLIGFVNKVTKEGNKVCKGYERGCRKILGIRDLEFCDSCRKKRQMYEMENLKRKIRVYKYNAKQRNIAFYLTDEQCIKFFKAPCELCNQSPPDKLSCGIDRIDNKKEYILENCRSCCTVCNLMKGSQDDVYFLKKIEHILNNLGIVETKDGLCPGAFGDHCASDYNRYKKNACDKNLQFKLTCEEFVVITSHKCYLCDKESNEYNINGVDRVNNTKGYIHKNVLTCCAECNYMKHINDIFKFIKKLYKVYIEKNCVERNLSDYDIDKIVESYLKNKHDEFLSTQFFSM